MTIVPARLPDGFVVRLHDDVEVGAFLVSGARVVRMSERARELLRDRQLVVTSDDAARLAGRLLDLDLVDPVFDDADALGLDALTLVVPVRDGTAGVDRLLGRLGGQVSCVVVDDASRDPVPLAEAVARHGGRLVRLDHNMGPAAARNVGLREVRTPLVAFIDCDVDVSVDDLRALLRHFADPGLAAVAPRVRSAGGRGWLGRYEEADGSLDLGPRAATTRAWSPVTYVPSACLVVRADTLDTGFDPRLRSGEDVDLVWRLQETGHRVRYAADIVVLHDARRAARAWLVRKAFYGSSAAALARRHGDRVAPAIMSPMAGAAFAGILLGRRWSIAAAAGCAAAVVRDTWRGMPDLPSRQRRQLVRATGVAMLRQTSGLLLRHWSPGSVVSCLVSRRARRVVTVLAVADGLLAYRSLRPGLDPVRFTLARRAEHLAYGIGVWRGAVRERSIRCLVPRWLPRRTAS